MSIRFHRHRDSGSLPAVHSPQGNVLVLGKIIVVDKHLDIRPPAFDPGMTSIRQGVLTYSMMRPQKLDTLLQMCPGI